MRFKQTLTIILLSAAGLTGCAHLGSNSEPGVEQYKAQFEKDPPTIEWLQEQTQALREKAWTEPTKRNVEIFDFFKSELDKRVAIEKKDSDWYAQTHRLLTNDWGNDGRGGAAMRQPAYIHVLANGSPSLSTIHHSRKAGTSLADDMVAPSLRKLAGLRQGAYSMYELSRWERYCNHGKGMDKRDWAFVVKEGLNNVPTSLIGQCNPPASVNRLQQ